MSDRRQVLRVVEDRPVRVRADLEVAARLPLVHVGVHVADDRKLDVALGARELRHRTDVDHLVHRRCQGNVGAGHAAHTRAPHTTGDDHAIRLDVTPGGTHAADAALLHIDADDLGVCGDVERAGGDRPLAHQRARAQRVHHSDARRVEAAQQDRLVDVRHQLLDLRRGYERGRFDSPRPTRSQAPRQLLHAFVRAGHLDPARLGENLELLVLPDALDGERSHLLGVIDQVDEVRGVAGRAARIGQRAFVHQHQVAPAQARQVVGDAVADDAAADHHGPGVLREARHLAHSGW